MIKRAPGLSETWGAHLTLISVQFIVLQAGCKCITMNFIPGQDRI